VQVGAVLRPFAEAEFRNQIRDQLDLLKWQAFADISK
jgi:hypothetical protein